MNSSLFSFSQVLRSRELGGRHFDWVEWDLLKRNAALYGDRPAYVDSFYGIDRNHWRERTWGQAFQDVNTIVANGLEHGVRKGAVVVSHLPNCIESTYLDLATSKWSAMHAGLNVDIGHAETLGLLEKLHPDIVVIVSEWHERPFADWYREAAEENPQMTIYVLTRPGEALPSGTHDFAELLDNRIWDRYQASDLDYLKTDPLNVHELLPTAGTTGVPKVSQRTTVD